MRRASEVIIYGLFISSQLLAWEIYAIMKSNLNKRNLDSVLGNFNLDESTTAGRQGIMIHLVTMKLTEADVTMVSFLLETAKSGQSVIRVL